MYNLHVFVEELNKTIILKVLSEDILERAQKDPVFLHKLCDMHLQLAGTNEIISNLQETEVTVNSIENVSSIYIWTETCVNLLLTLYEEHVSDFREGVKKRKDIWDSIAEELKSKGYEVNGAQCQSKFNSLKRTYKKMIVHKNTTGNERKSWPHFERMNDIFGSTAWVRRRAAANEAGPSSSDQEAEFSTTKQKNRIKKLESVLDALKSASDDAKKRRIERNKEKSKKLELLMAQKERHHKEKMDLIKTLIDTVSK